MMAHIPSATAPPRMAKAAFCLTTLPSHSAEGVSQSRMEREITKMTIPSRAYTRALSNCSGWKSVMSLASKEERRRAVVGAVDARVIAHGAGNVLYFGDAQRTPAAVLGRAEQH